MGVLTKCSMLQTSFRWDFTHLHHGTLAALTNSMCYKPQRCQLGLEETIMYSYTRAVT